MHTKYGECQKLKLSSIGCEGDSTSSCGEGDSTSSCGEEKTGSKIIVLKPVLLKPV
jgi:hypothetical protein